MTTSTLERIYAAAAEARNAGVAQVSHRPSQRRFAEEPGSAPVARIRSPHIELRAASDGSDTLHFSGFASVYNRGYEMWDMFGPYTEQVSSGAGANSLARTDLDVPLVLQHDALRRIARTTNDTLTLDERTMDVDGEQVEGLYCDAPELSAADPDVAYIAHKMRSDGDRGPLIDEMSFRFRIVRGEWSPDWMEYHIQEYDVHRGDVAIVAYGANPFTVGAGLRSLPPLGDLTDEALRSLESSLHAERAKRSAATTPAEPSMSRAVLGAIDDFYRG